MNKDHLIKLYTVYVQTIISNEQRRLQTSIFYLSLITAGITFWGSREGIDLYLSVFVFLISLIWYLSIRYYRKLSNSKFFVINQIEDYFDVKPFDAEWRHFKQGGKISMGLSRLDMLIPLIPLFISVIFIIYNIC